jgi:ribonucleotide reductase alpha subunit
MIYYDDIKKSDDKKYFDGYDFSKEIWVDNYKGPGEETIIDTWQRIAHTTAAPEDSSYKKEIEEKFFDALEDFKFVPGGRIMANLGIKGREGTTLFNCFVHHPKDINMKDADSIEGIYTLLKAQAHTLKSEGGYGLNCSFLRPAGSYVKGIGARTPGPLNFMELWDKSSEIITKGSDKIVGDREESEKRKIRKGAQMLVMTCFHPDIIDFIKAKQTPGRLTKFNMSVGITGDFMKAVDTDGDWKLRFPDTTFEKYKDEWFGDIDEWEEKKYPVILYETIKARDLWDIIMLSTYKRNEPGVLFLDVANKLNPLFYCEDIYTTNPCVSGDTLVAVADGRNAVSIKQLAEENKEVDVYSIKDNKVCISKAIKVFKTKSNAQVLKITLDDNSSFKCTPNHEIMFRNGTYKPALELKVGDSLMPFNSYTSNKNYRQIASNTGRDRRQYRLIAEYNGLIVDAKNTAIHHRNYNSLDDSFDNLQPMSHNDHKELHRIRMMGKNNPMNTWYKTCSQEERNKYHIDMSKSVSNEKNGNYSGIANDELKRIVKEEILKKQRQISQTEYRELAINAGLPLTFSNFRKKRFGSICNLIKSATLECGYKYYKKYELRTLIHYNHKIKSIEVVENEDVYDMTVPDIHNFGIITSNKDAKFIESSGIFVHNCGEVPMPTGVCNLGSINVVKFIKETKDGLEFDIEKFKAYIPIGIRFLDNILDISRAPLKEYKTANIEKRRIGLGTFGWGSLHYILGIRYGSKESLELVEKVAKAKAEAELLASAQLGKEKGSFPLFDKEKYFSSYWWKNLKISSKVKEEIEHIGHMRNSHHSMNAPTGNTSVYSQMISSGIEPVFIEEYIRWAIVSEYERGELKNDGFKFPDRSLNEWKETEHMKFIQRGDEQILKGTYKGTDYEYDKNRGLIKSVLIEDYGWKFAKSYYKDGLHKMKKNGIFATTNDLVVDDHINVLKIFAHYTNMAISKTVNIPNDYSFEEFKTLYLNAHKANIKGITTYRAGTMTAVLEEKKDSVEIDGNTVLSNAPKRPKILDADIYVVSVKNEKFVIAVGLLNNKPYEIFGGSLNGLGFKFQYKKGKIEKIKRGLYKLEIGDEIEVDDFSKHFTPTAQILFRLASTSLRHGVPIEFIVEQLQKSEDDMFSMSAAAARVLKKYVTDGSKFRGASCPTCSNNELIYQDGCISCKCGWSKCN